MPTVQSLLTDIDALLPNIFTNDQKIVWMNEAQKILFKYMNDTEIYEFDTVKDQPFYNLPSNCTIDLIISVSISEDLAVTSNTKFTPYLYAATNQNLVNNYYDATGGLIGLYPIPGETGHSVKIIYEKRPALLSSSSLTLIPDVNEDYQPALEFYVLRKIATAGNNPDVQLGNMYGQMWNDIIDMLFKDLMEKKVKAPVKTKANAWWNR